MSGGPVMSGCHAPSSGGVAAGWLVTGGDRRDGRTELAVADLPSLEAQAEASGAPPRPQRELGIVGLGEVDDPTVVAEVERQELRVGIQAKTPDDQAVEVPGQEVGQVEGPRLLVGELGEGSTARVDLVAVGA